MLSFKRLTYLAAVTLLVAGIIHIVIILLIPSYAAKDAWAKLGAADNFWKFAPLTSAGRKDIALPLLDPAFSVSACRFDLNEAPLKVQASGNLAFWSVAIFDRLGSDLMSAMRSGETLFDLSAVLGDADHEDIRQVNERYDAALAELRDRDYEAALLFDEQMQAEMVRVIEGAVLASPDFADEPDSDDIDALAE